MDTLRIAYISAGSNIGDRLATLQSALRTLDATPGVRVAQASAIYETDPVGDIEQPAFLNLATRLETTLSPEDLLRVLHEVERAHGRRREQEVRWGPRTLDLDLLLFAGETRSSASLTLPHPRMWERSFVLIPLRDVADRRDTWLAAQLAKSPAADPSVRKVG